MAHIKKKKKKCLRKLIKTRICLKRLLQEINMLKSTRQDLAPNK